MANVCVPVLIQLWSWMKKKICFSDVSPPDETDGVEDVHMNVTVTCCGGRSRVENEATRSDPLHSVDAVGTPV